MSYRARLSVLLASTVIGAMGVVATASAQEAETEASTKKSTGYTMLDLIVIGAGRDKVAIDTPQAVTVLDQETIDDAQASTIGEIFSSVPGVSIVGSDRAGGQSFNIRGVGDLASADESKIIVSVDGAVKFYEQYRMGSFFSDPELYKSVEVLRGPASSTLYGAGAIGGVVNFTTKDADDFIKDGHKAAVRLKSQYDTNMGGALGSVIAAYTFSDQTSVLLNGNFRSNQNFIAGSGDVISGSDAKSISGLAKVTHRFGDQGEQVLRASYQRWSSDADNTDYSQTGTLSAFGKIDRDITDQTAVISYENPATANSFLDLKANLTYSDTQVKQSNSDSGAGGILSDSKYGYQTWSAKLENTFESKWSQFENYLTLGTQLSYQQRVADSADGAITTHPEGNDRKIGIFAQDELIIADKLTLIPGVRLDFVSLDPDSSIVSATSQSDVAFSPKLAALYKFNDTLSIFGSIAHTERMPTLDEMFSTAGPGRGWTVNRTASMGLEKETSNNYEAGFSVAFDDLVQDGDGFRLKATGFYNDLRNLIDTRSSGTYAGPVSYYQNIGKARIMGIELEGSYDSTYAFGSFAFSRMFGEDLEAKTTLDSVPATTLNLTLGGKVPDYDLTFGWTGDFVATRRESNGTRFGAYSVHNLFASWKPQEGRMEDWEFRASADNIFDRKYLNSLAGDEGKGRTFKLTATKQFNW
ncbi:MAG: TonB-dependent receptor [Rhodobacteraceae bacterium]|nr:TonB-dependent receptor [Paracoccaceae bacterium]